MHTVRRVGVALIRKRAWREVILVVFTRRVTMNPLFVVSFRVIRGNRQTDGQTSSNPRCACASRNECNKQQMWRKTRQKTQKEVRKRAEKGTPISANANRKSVEGQKECV